MALSLDHIFVCTSVCAPEATLLLDAGLVEGTGNGHTGQGTSNRRFFFDHGFLELLWVHDEQEATSPRTRPTRLWERWSGRDKHANPFGIYFTSQSESNYPLPFASWAYEPAYLPKGKRIHFAEGTALSEPEMVALSWPRQSGAVAAQPRAHKLPLRSVSAVSVGLSDVEQPSAPMHAARDSGLVRIHKSSRPELVVEFSSPASIRVHFPSLGISLLGQPGGAA
ncbi:VOC family protein [Cyanobium sp. PCC 7001]|uniref:VOC family protein n=1 Tax=Cyanobium sp. PCC 7001 TaxID=180281 RepID=UPI0008FEF781|nr:VOC family protein [Cyanobium sp. PCC 7001]